MSYMTPREIVHELDRYIIGQDAAKKAVSNALRNRWRRLQLPEKMRDEITPKNILMVGPTGVGKTEIARRLARLAGAPFLKVEATKFTEVGYVGRDVESILRDLIDVAVKMLREERIEEIRHQAAEAAEERILDALSPKSRVAGPESNPERSQHNRQILRKKLREGELDNREIEIEVSSKKVGMEIMTPPGMEEMASQLQDMFSNMMEDRRRTIKLKIRDARRRLEEEEASRQINEDEIKSQAVERVEQLGIIFIDEIDKVTSRSDRHTADVSREGVQRDLLPLIEGCTLWTKYGMVSTNHVLFIASGAFHLSKPSDLIPELQGRLPVRVELKALTPEEFRRVLVEPRASLTKQYQALLSTENVQLEFSPDGIRRIAEIAWQINEATENIGARRLHTVMERLLEDLSFEAPERGIANNEATVIIDAEYVDRQLESLAGNEDLARYIL